MFFNIWIIKSPHNCLSQKHYRSRRCEIFQKRRNRKKKEKKNIKTKRKWKGEIGEREKHLPCKVVSNSSIRFLCWHFSKCVWKAGCAVCGNWLPTLWRWTSLSEVENNQFAYIDVLHKKPDVNTLLPVSELRGPILAPIVIEVCPHMCLNYSSITSLPPPRSANGLWVGKFQMMRDLTYCRTAC